MLYPISKYAWHKLCARCAKEIWFFVAWEFSFLFFGNFQPNKNIYAKCQLYLNTPTKANWNAGQLGSQKPHKDTTLTILYKSEFRVCVCVCVSGNVCAISLWLQVKFPEHLLATHFQSNVAFKNILFRWWHTCSSIYMCVCVCVVSLPFESVESFSPTSQVNCCFTLISFVHMHICYIYI